MSNSEAVHTTPLLIPSEIVSREIVVEMRGIVG
jgi:hypothetical protein